MTKSHRVATAVAPMQAEEVASVLAECILRDISGETATDAVVAGLMRLVAGFVAAAPEPYRMQMINEAATALGNGLVEMLDGDAADAILSEASDELLMMDGALPQWAGAAKGQIRH